MADIAHLRTPSPSRFKARNLIDSPFSDYYTDTSPGFSPEAKFTSPFQQKLLRRLDRIGTQVLRRALSDDASKDIEIGLDALENRIQAPEVKSREPADVADSGLFVDEEDEDVYDSQEDSSDGPDEDMTKSRDGLGMRMSGSPEEEFLDSPWGSVKEFLASKVVMDAEEADTLVKRVTKLAGELRKRHEEVKHMNDQMVNRLETASNEVLQLRSENEALRADLSFDHSELLFLKLQLKAVQLSIEPQLPADGQYTSSVSKSLSDGLERWKKDWKDVDLKFQARRAKYGMADFPTDLEATHTESTSGTVVAPHEQPRAPEELRLPTKIVSIRRPMAHRSFTTPPAKGIIPLPAEPPTPSLTSGSESGDDDLDNGLEEVVDPPLSEPPTAESGATLTSGAPQDTIHSDEVPVKGEEDNDVLDNEVLDDDVLDNDDDDDEGEQSLNNSSDDDDFDEDDDDDGNEDDGEHTTSTDTSDDDAIITSRPHRTPWQELWDGLTELTGMRTDDD